MAGVSFLHVCERAYVDEQGRGCIIGIVDYFEAPTFPTVTPHMAVAFGVQGQQFERVPITVDIREEDGTVLARVDTNITCGEDGRAPVGVKMDGSRFRAPGTYSVNVLSSGKPLASTSIEVRTKQTGQ